MLRKRARDSYADDVELQKSRSCNINFMAPKYMFIANSGSSSLALPMGLKLLLMYSTGSATDSLESIRLMNEVKDIYMPDFKYRG